MSTETSSPQTQVGRREERAPHPKADAPPLEKLKSLRTVLRFMLPYKGLMIGAGLALLVAAAATLGIFKSLELVVDRGFAADSPGAIDRYFLGLLGVIFILAAATFLRFKMVTLLGERVVADMRKAVYARLISLHPWFFEENRPGEIASRLTADTTIIQTVVGSSLSIALRNAVMLMGGVVLLFTISPKLMGLISLVVPLVVGPLIFFGRRVRKLSQHSQTRVAWLGTLANEVFGAIQTVQAFTREREEKARFDDAVEETYAVARQRIRARSWLTAMVILLIFGAIDLVLWQGAKDVIAGNMTGGEMAAFVGLSVLTAGAVGALSEVYGDLMRAAGASERLAELLRVTPEIRAPEKAKPVKNTLKGAIRFSGVDFAYPSKPGILALKDFDLAVEPGETVALVGPSGAGKSTVFQLLLRFFDPKRGFITIDGLKLDEVDPVALRRHMSVVPQDIVIFAGTIEANVRYGKPEATEKDVLAALGAAQCMEFVERLPDGLKTELGERGIRLSGGQRQRLAIARSILRDAPVLLLDEATSALDAEAERKVQKALNALMANRTTLVIAHRLATVRRADRIAVMDEGRVVATGPHEELLKSSDLYGRLAKLQFADVGEGDLRPRRATVQGPDPSGW